MRKKTVVILITLFAFLALIGTAYAQATADDAKALVQKAKEFYKAQGKDKAFAAFKDPQGEFVKGDLYIYVMDLDGKMLVHPKADMVGKDFTVVKDKDGKLFACDMVKIAKEKGSGWVDYKWENPATKTVDPKTAYFEKVDNVIIAAGAYKK